MGKSQIEIIIKKNKESCNNTKLLYLNIRLRSKFRETIRACEVSNLNKAEYLISTGKVGMRG